MNDLTLHEIKDIITANDPELGTVAQWAREYLCNTDAALGRSGPVCPWSVRSMQLGLFWLYRFNTAGLDDKQIDITMLGLIKTFRFMRPTDSDLARFKTIVVVLPDIRDGRKVDAIHARLKPIFLAAGLMLGEFYPDCAKGGLRNPDFKALQSPTALLVIRTMLVSDIAFLTDDQRFVALYRATHGEDKTR